MPDGSPSETDIARWRKAERDRLIAERLAIDPDTRLAHAGRIAASLEASIGPVSGRIVSVYWPFRGEPDLRGFMERVTGNGGTCALPVVVERARPVVFRAWKPGDRLERGVWNIPVPADGAEVVPDVVVAPVVGFDPHCYRLGYGGGYYDRTLAALTRRPAVFGVGYAAAAIATIHPQPHDIPMDAIVTETGVIAPKRSA
ncbi:5-formyltetrahydrofolate cyclo-ligase [Microbaculum marinum]|uniref:5-formyltetrahydrofolate cyclo-ligase n=1 Tax=Microbaculum marinum TaxID=1764581 RepID=A0AAW9RRJ3_9HYPH